MISPRSLACKKTHTPDKSFVATLLFVFSRGFRFFFGRVGRVERKSGKSEEHLHWALRIAQRCEAF